MDFESFLDAADWWNEVLTPEEWQIENLKKHLRFYSHIAHPRGERSKTNNDNEYVFWSAIV